MIKIFIGHFTWLPDNPCVFAWDPAQVGKGGVMVLKEVDCRGRSREEEYRVGEGSGTPAVLGRPGGRGAPEVLRPELERMLWAPYPTHEGSTCRPLALT